MGQGSSQPSAERGSDIRQYRRRSMLQQSNRRSAVDDGRQDELLHGRSQPRLRSTSTNRLSQLLHLSDGERATENRRPAPLQRTASRFRDLISRRDTSSRSTETSGVSLNFLQSRTSYVRAGMNRQGADYYSPRLPSLDVRPRLPSIDVSSTFGQDAFNSPDEPESLPRSSGSNRLPNIRFNSLRPDRPFRHFTSSLRRRRTPPEPSSRRTGVEDQAAMLSRLLSVAAAATAATLMGDDHHALSEARSLTGNAGMSELGSGGEDGSFDGFLRALQNGRIASALRQGSGNDGDAEGASREGPLNFFRMFRFGSSGATDPAPLGTGFDDSSETGENTGEGRMVPIIIVGIRSINPNTGSGSAADDLPPFIDALGNFPSPLPATALGSHGQDSIDSILQPPQNGTSFRHRRRASMGGFGMNHSRISDRLDDQRDHRSPDRRRERPWSMASSSSNLEPRPPPATPASPSPELSRISSRNSTPVNSRPASFVANSVRDFGGESRRNSTLNRAAAGSPLSSHTEESSSLHSTHSNTNLLSDDAGPFRFHSHRRSDTAPNIHYPRFASGHPRRNGVVEPDNLPSLSRSSTSNGTDSTATGGSSSSSREGRHSTNDSRSWIIYVLGGSYPENHPILTTPSLFTENPTYEDMMLLSALLGPAKAPVASEEDVMSAGGIYTIEVSTIETDAEKTAQLVAVATGSESGLSTDHQAEQIALEIGQRCLVCLCDFEIEEICRKLVKCGHLFHQECIDQVCIVLHEQLKQMES